MSNFKFSHGGRLKKFLAVPKALIILFFSIVWVANLAAQEKPSKELVNQVLGYYYSNNGQLGAVLTHLKFCDAIHLEGPQKFNCKGEIKNLQLKIGQTVVVWMQYFGVKNQNHNVILQFERDNQVLSTVELSIRGSIRYRYPYNYTPKTKGAWKLKVLHVNEDFTEELGVVDYQVVP